jgi:hypothetical protein
MRNHGPHLPFMHARDALFHNMPRPLPVWVYIFIFIGGWINPVFVVTALLDLMGNHPRVYAALRVAVLLMIPLTWVFAFYYLRTYPREGHFLWIIGMVLVLFSEEIGSSFSSQRQFAR